MRGRSGAVRVRKPLSYEKKKNLAGLLFILPWAIGTVFFFLKPFISSVVYSFSRVDYTTNTVVPVGLEHYMQAFTKDAEFLRRVTSSWSSLLYQVPLIVLFSLFIAIILNQKFIGRTVMRGIFFLPVIIASGIVLSIIQGDVFSDTIMSSMSSGKLFQADFMRQLLYESSLNESLVSTVTTAIDNIFSLVWKSGIQILLFIAGLQNVSPQMYEAAKIEGATGWESFWKITFPIISPITIVNLVYTIMDCMTDIANPIMQYIQSVIDALQMEYSMALSWVYFAVCIVGIGIVYAIVNRFVYYEV